MIGLLQRVDSARVDVAGETVARVGRGILVLVGVLAQDAPADAGRLAERLLGYRVFADADGRMNMSVADIGGGVLLVPQFTLTADTHKGNRASFTPAAAPDTAAELFRALVEQVSGRHAPVAAGCFGADMKIALVNDGPVTFWLSSR